CGPAVLVGSPDSWDGLAARELYTLSLHDELRRMGADIKLEQESAIVRGVERLTGAPVEVSDLRAGAALVIAALAADGETHVSGAEILNRGYERIDQKLVSLGANIVADDSLPQPLEAFSELMRPARVQMEL